MMELILSSVSTFTSPNAEDRWLSEDKFFHPGFSFGFVGLAYNGARTLEVPHGRALAGSASLGLVLGVLKELRDIS